MKRYYIQQKTYSARNMTLFYDFNAFGSLSPRMKVVASQWKSNPIRYSALSELAMSLLLIRRPKIFTSDLQQVSSAQQSPADLNIFLGIHLN